jgi:threonylcarbamoyladenosine tRNA methylthiotransferase MtaB
MINKARKLNDSAVIVVMGCYAQISPKDVEQIEGVSLVIGTKDRKELLIWSKII